MATAKRRELELKVGLTAGIALILLVITIFTVEKIHFGERGYSIEVAFKFVDALKPQSDVKIGGGVKIGYVADIQVENDQIILKVLLENDVKLPKNSKFQILSKGVMGDKYLNVVAVPTAGSIEIIQPGERVDGMEPANIDKAFERLAQVADSIELVVGDPKLLGSFTDVMKNFARLSGRLDRIIQKNETDINRGIKDMSQAAATINSFSQDLATSTQGLKLLLADENMKNIGTFLNDLQRISTRLDKQLELIEAGKGTLGILLHDEQIGEDLKSAVKDIKTHPWKLLWKQ